MKHKKALSTVLKIVSPQQVMNIIMTVYIMIRITGVPYNCGINLRGRGLKIYF